jgi:hypothetical protein
VAVGGVADHLRLPSERGTWPSKLAAMIMRRVGRVNSCHRPLPPETSRRDPTKSAYKVKAVVPADIVRRPSLTQSERTANAVPPGTGRFRDCAERP